MDIRPPATATRHLFIVGSPRSGTTWMQLLLAQHPSVATSQETHLFSAYLGPLIRSWERERRLPEDRRPVGLTTVLGSEDFRAVCTAFADGVFDRVRAANPDAELLVEKTPTHVLMVKEILEVYPEASFLHVIRDPRAVVCSLRSAGRGWGRHWAPTNPADGARLWRRRVEAGLGIRRLTPRYHEVRYEDLAADAAGELARLGAAVGLDAGDEFCRKAARACEMERLRQGGRRRAVTPWRLGEEPEGFFRRGEPDGWKDELTRGELRRVEHLASPLMAELGYEPITAPTERRPLRVALREVLEWRLERLHERSRGIVERL